MEEGIKNAKWFAKEKRANPLPLSVVEKDQATVAMYVDVGRPTQHFNVV
jgi:hypothetical protein